MEALCLPPSLSGLPLAETTVGRSSARVFRAGEDAYLKVGPAGSLLRAAGMQEYMAGKGFSAPLIHYETWRGQDYLLTRAVPGRNALAFTDRPEWLCDRLGEALRSLHGTDAADCPFRDVNQQAIALYGRQTGHPFTGNASCLRADQLTHGDCCLPNILMDGPGVTGLTDLGEGGLGDGHFDLYWAMWSLEYNLKTDRYNRRFLDAYGMDGVDEERLDCCRRLSRCAD